MGLFDTIHLSEPLHLPEHGVTVTELQTKEFGSAMRDYTVGSVLCESPVLIGVVEESIWIAPREKGEAGTLHPVYLAIWHRILAGVYFDPDEAEARLKAIDRLDLIAWLDQAQRDARRWQRRYHALFADVKEWTERRVETETEARIEAEPEQTKRYRSLFHHLPDDILKAPDPLVAILEMHREKESEKDGDGWL